jgi:hypothetical protein
MTKLREATDITPPVSEKYLREVAAKALEARNYQKVADCIRSGMRSSNWPEMLVDPGIIIDALEVYSRVPQPPAYGRDDVLEEAAKQAEWNIRCGCKRDDCYSDRIPEEIAKQIRALKSPPNTTDTVLAGAGGLK